MNDEENTKKIEVGIVNAAQKGDIDAFSKIVALFSNALLSVAYSVLGDFHEAQDVTQESFIKSYRSLHTLKDPKKLGSWLYAITHRTSLDLLKKRKKHLALDKGNYLIDDSIDSWVYQHEIHESIWDALSSLKEKNRTVIVLHYLSGWTMKEIAQFLDVSLSAVDSRIRRSKEMLKRHLSDDFSQYFIPYKLDDDFERNVCEQVLKKMGHFYIPVKNKSSTREWFAHHFQLNINWNGNLLLESGEELYLLECRSYRTVTTYTSDIPRLTFSVLEIDAIWNRLRGRNVRVGQIEYSDMPGKYFSFYDPDGNKFLCLEIK